MKKIALCVFGASGTGKSSLLETVAGMCSPTPTIVRGSTILKESLGVASYEALESISAREKKQVLLSGMASLATESSNRTIIVDTHLVVPIRASVPLAVEDMWDDQLLKIFQGFIYISASAGILAERRRMDAERSLRTTRAALHICAEDLQLNARRWDEISPAITNKKVIINDQTISIGAGKIVNFLRTFSEVL